MPTQTLKDAKYRPIAYIDTDSRGVQTIKDKSYRVLGTYDPKTNETKDSHFRKVGEGNLLASLIPPNQY